MAITDGPRRMRINQDDVLRMYAHAEDCAPNEACGMLAGEGDRVDSVYALANADESPYTYSIDSRDQIRTIRDAETRGLEIIGGFHSHTHTDAYPSETDVRQAFYPEWIYALISLKGEDPALHAYRIVDSVITEIPVTVDV